MEFADDINRVLKYSMDTVENLLGQLHNDFQARYTQPAEFNDANNHHTLLRNVVADALADAGRNDEEALLRNPEQHVVVRDGQVKKGRFTTRRVWYGGLSRSRFGMLRDNPTEFRSWVKARDTGDGPYEHFGAGGYPTILYEDMISDDGYRLLQVRGGQRHDLIHTREEPEPPSE